jgi:hypothetical protein
MVPPNTCPLGPDFNGLDDIALVDQGGNCVPELNWSDAVETCAIAPGLSYNVYRSSDPLFVPGPANLAASGLTALSYLDAGAPTGVPLFYVVRAEDGQSGFPGPNNGGKEDPNLAVKWVTLGDPFAAGQLDDPGGDGSAWLSTDYWSVNDGGNTTPAGRLSYQSVAHGSRYYNADICGALTTPDLVIGAGATLSYQASYNLEVDWDGVVVEISTDLGQSWSDLPPAGGYPGSFAATQGNGCGFAPSRLAFSGPAGNGAPTPFAAYTSDLSAYAGQTARIRWRLSSDGALEYEGFRLDDVRIAPATAPPGGRCSGCVPSSPDVVPNRLWVAPMAAPQNQFLWTSFEGGQFNVHGTNDKTQIPALWSLPPTQVGTSPERRFVDDGSLTPIYYQVYGADSCTGLSVP